MNIEVYVDGNIHAYACLLVARNAEGGIAKKRMISDVLNGDWTPTQATWHGAQVGLDTLTAGGHSGDVYVFTRLKNLIHAGSGKVSWHYLLQNELQEEAFQEAARILLVYRSSELVEAVEFSLDDYFSPANIEAARERSTAFVADVETARIERREQERTLEQKP